MKHKNKTIITVGVFLIGLFCIFDTFGEIIVLKSENRVEGKIVDRTSEYIILDISGVSITYYLDEIESIDGKKIMAGSGDAESRYISSDAKDTHKELSSAAAWESWYENIKDYIERIEAIDKKSKEAANQLNIKLQAAMQKRDNELARQVLIESGERLGALLKEVKALKPPQELEIYHAKAVASYDYMKKANEAVLRNDKDSVFAYNNAALVSLIESLEELKEVYISHGAPKEYIESLAAIIKKYNQISNKDLQNQ